MDKNNNMSLNTFIPQQTKKQSSTLMGEYALYLQYINQLIKVQLQILNKMMMEEHQLKQQNKNINSANIIRYQLKDDPFTVPIKFKREIPINKNFFELHEMDPKNYNTKQDKVQMSEMIMLDPLQMNVATIKFILLQKIIAYISIFSICLSIYQVYFIQEQSIKNSLINFHTAITALLMSCILVSTFFHYQNNKSRRVGNRNLVFQTILKTIVAALSPNPWWGIDSLILHLTLLGRFFFPLTLYIRTTIYYSPRASRMLNLYGIKPQLTFQFAWKVILNCTNIMQVIFIYICVVLFFSHCLYLAAETTPFIDCFQMVIVTLPTIGYGEYHLTDNNSKIVILIILLTGVPLNAFVTLSMLKKFEMTTNENNSYILMEKLNMIQQIEELSSEFIIRKFQKRKSKSTVLQKQKDENFKEQYKQCKAIYRKMSTQDSAYQFSYFKDTLLTFKIKIHQANNMINVLLSKLINYKRERKIYFKEMNKEK